MTVSLNFDKLPEYGLHYACQLYINAHIKAEEETTVAVLHIM